MAELRALLLIDVVDSTSLTQQLEESAAASLWSAHDRLARDLIPQWRGREIDKTDGILVLFDRVGDAVGYALDYHAAMRALRIEARAGIHFGPVSLRANPAQDVARGAKPIEVGGIALPIVARIMSIALRAQTLLSEDARQALGAVPQRIQSHGHWLLHGVAEPIELFEIVPNDTPFKTPGDVAKAHRVLRLGDTWQPLRDLRHSLPAERDGFVGRRVSLDALSRKVEAGGRLISVLGIGGVGKTRLVTRFAWTQRVDYTGGVWFCDLSHARGIDGILFAVAQGLDVPLGQSDPVVQIGQAIAGRGKCLVLLDNFEQVARFAEETLGRWLECAPLAQFIVTTREVLGIVGEEIFTASPLDQEDAIELFLKRAEAARHGFAPAHDDLTAIDKLVRMLDGLPLAIELAAARIRMLAPRALLARMNDRFDVLLSGAGRSDRQATLRATFDWSWELLTETEKGILAQLSVFLGGFTLESAGAVVGVAPRRETFLLLDILQSLHDKSLVRRVSDERFDLLESVREYAAQHLRAEGRFEGSGPACEAETCSRHWRHFAALDDRSAVASRCAELDNLVAGCRRAAEAGDGPSAVGCLVAAWTALRLTGPYQAAVDLAAGVGRMSSLDDLGKAWVHWVAGDALDTLGHVEAARPHVELGLRLARQAKDPISTARLLIVRGGRQGLDGDPDGALISLTEAHHLGEARADEAVQSSALIVLGRVMEYQSRFAESRMYYDQALALAQAREDRRAEGGILGNLGGIHHALGELEQARNHYERALTLLSKVGDRRWEGNGHCNLGLLYQEQGHTVEARSQFDMALNTAREIGHARLAHVVLCNLGILLAAEGQLNEAAQHLDDAVEGAIATSDRRAEGQSRGCLALVLAKQGRMLDARNMAIQGESLLVASADPLSHALLLCDRAELELLASELSVAEDALHRAERIADEISCGPDSELRRRIAAIGAALPVR